MTYNYPDFDSKFEEPVFPEIRHREYIEGGEPVFYIDTYVRIKNTDDGKYYLQHFIINDPDLIRGYKSIVSRVWDHVHLGRLDNDIIDFLNYDKPPYSIALLEDSYQKDEKTRLKEKYALRLAERDLHKYQQTIKARHNKVASDEHKRYGD